MKNNRKEKPGSELLKPKNLNLWIASDNPADFEVAGRIIGKTLTVRNRNTRPDARISVKDARRLLGEEAFMAAVAKCAESTVHSVPCDRLTKDGRIVMDCSPMYRNMRKNAGYPRNLAMTVLNGKAVDRPDADIENSLQYLFDTRLSPKRTAVLLCRYRDGKTLDKTGEELGITKERVRQLEAKALADLRRGNQAEGILLNGVTAELEREAEMERQAREAGNIPVSRLGLTTRPLCILMRNGCRTTGDVLALSREQFLTMRHLTVKNRRDIVTALERFGYDCSRFAGSEANAG